MADEQTVGQTIQQTAWEKQTYSIFVTTALQVLVTTAASQGFSANFESGLESFLAAAPSHKFLEEAGKDTVSFMKSYEDMVRRWDIDGLVLPKLLEKPTDKPSFKDIYFWAQALDLGPDRRSDPNWGRVSRIRALVLERLATDIQYRMKTLFKLKEKSHYDPRILEEVLDGLPASSVEDPDVP